MWIVMVDTNCDDPDVIGPFLQWHKALDVADIAQTRFGKAWVQKMFPTISELVGAVADHLDEVS